MADHPPPYSHSFDLASLGDAERTIELHPSPEARAAIAVWAELASLDSFSASVRLRRTSGDLFEYEASFTAEVTQPCVVTLEPVHGHLTGTATREFRVLPRRARRHVAEDEPADTGDGDVETLKNGIVDLAAPVLEDFMLAIDPYPRAAGAVFQAPPDADEAANPFSELGKLKGKA